MSIYDRPTEALGAISGGAIPPHPDRLQIKEQLLAQYANAKVNRPTPSYCTDRPPTLPERIESLEQKCEDLNRKLEVFAGNTDDRLRRIESLLGL